MAGVIDVDANKERVNLWRYYITTDVKNAYKKIVRNRDREISYNEISDLTCVMYTNKVSQVKWISGVVCFTDKKNIIEVQNFFFMSKFNDVSIRFVQLTKEILLFWNIEMAKDNAYMDEFKEELSFSDRMIYHCKATTKINK